MTQEEKAKAYDAAIDRARWLYEFYKDGKTKGQVFIDIFPELKESEDERIRKELISIVENWKEYNPKSPFADRPIYVDNAAKCDKILAWLEKQSEKNNTKHSFLQDAFDKSRRYTLDEKKEASEYSESILPTSIEYGESEDEYKLHTIIEAAFIAGQNKRKPTDYGNSIYCRQVEQKPAEWSDE